MTWESVSEKEAALWWKHNPQMSVSDLRIRPSQELLPTRGEIISTRKRDDGSREVYYSFEPSPFSRLRSLDTFLPSHLVYWTAPLLVGVPALLTFTEHGKLALAQSLELSPHLIDYTTEGGPYG